MSIFSFLIDGFDFQKTLTSVDDMSKAAFEFMRKREMGHPEVMDRILGHSLHSGDMAVAFLNTNAPTERIR